MIYTCHYHHCHSSYFFFNDTATTEIYTLSLHDALPIWIRLALQRILVSPDFLFRVEVDPANAPSGSAYRVSDVELDRKSTRLNSSHSQISYAVFCLKKKKKIYIQENNPSLNQHYI